MMTTLSWTSAWPSLPVESADTLRDRRRAVVRWCQCLVVSVVVGSRLAIPLGSGQVPLSLLTGWLFLGCIALREGVPVSIRRLLGVGLVLAVVFIESTCVHAEFSRFSALYVGVLYGPLILAPVKMSSEELKRVWGTFSGVACVAAILGGVQLAVQTVAPGVFLDPLQWLPSAFLLEGYQTTYPILRGVFTMLKPNGMFLLEPSFFSQIVGLGLLSEVIYFRRRGRILILTAALIASFSGTGILTVLVPLLVFGRARLLAGVALLAGVSLAVLSAVGYSDALVNRVGELAAPGSSGHERMVAPFQAIWQSATGSGEAALFGQGAGRSKVIDTATPEPSYSAIPKVTIEYGLVGLAAFAVMWWTFFSRPAIDRSLALAGALVYFLLSGALLQPFSVFLLWGLSIGLGRSESPVPTAAGLTTGAAHR